MELTNDFRVALPLQQAWAVLTDLERIAPCMPGAQLQEIEGDEHRGIVKIKVGPITAQYKGQATFLQRDDATHVAVLRAEGRETRGQGNANATITAALVADGDGTAVSVITDLTVTGRVAQFGRGVLADVSAKLLDQFVASLEKMVLADESAEVVPVSAAPAPDTAAPDTAAPETVAAAPAATEPTTPAPAKPLASKPAAAKKAPADPKPTAAKKAPAAKKATAAKESAAAENPAAVAAPTAREAPAATSAAAAATEAPGSAPAPAVAAPVSGSAGAPPAATPAAPASPAIRRIDSPEPQAVNLLDAAGSPVAKRVGPILAAVAVLWLLKKLLSRRKR